MAQMQVFVSHSHEDDAFCRAVVAGLHGAGADVWYDEHNMGSGRLGPTIERELRLRPVFVVILSPAALRSQWVEDETRWAYGLLRRDATRIIQPVTASTISEDEIWLFLQDFKRIEASGCQPYQTNEATRRLLRALALAPEPVPSALQPTKSVTDLLKRGKALMAWERYVEALPFIEVAAQASPSSFDAWFNLSRLLSELHRDSDAISAYDRTLALDPTSALAWTGKGDANSNLGHYDEALAAYDRALALDPSYALAWDNKAKVLRKLQRYDEALAAYNRALALDSTYVTTTANRTNQLGTLGHVSDATAGQRGASEPGE